MSKPESSSSELTRATEPRLLQLPGGDTAVGQAYSVVDPWVIDWRRVVAAVVRFKWVAILVTLVGTGASIVASRLIKPAYTTHATLWVDVPDMHDRSGGPIQTAQLVASTGWVDLLESHAVLNDVVRRERLYLSLATPDDSAALASFGVKERVEPGAYRLAVARDEARFVLTTDRGAVLQRGAVGDSVGAALGFTWLPPAGELRPGRTIAFSVTTTAAAAQQLADQLRVKTDMLGDKVGNFMSVELRGSDADGITAVVNAIADRFVTVAAELRRQKLSQLVSILGEQVRHAQLNLTQAEQALRDFRVRTVTVLSGTAGPLFASPAQGRDPAAASFFDMRVSREELRLDRVALERVLREGADSGLSTDALETIASVQQSSALTQALRELTEKQATLRALRYRYTDGHLPVRRLAADITALQRQTIPAMVRALIAQLAVREAGVARRVDSAAGGLRQMPPLAIEEARLERDVTIAAQLFANIQQRYEEVRLAEVSSIPEVRILDRAERPEAPLFSVASLLIVMAFMGSSVVGVLGAVVLDRFDSRVRHPDQVTRAMGLTILGAVPHVGARNGKSDEVAPVIEALRAIRLRVVHAHGSAGPIVVTISSPGRSDGKSLVAANLALAFADTGYRTLLVDGDIRRGSLHRVLKAARKPGLTDLLAGTATREQVLRATAYPSLWLIACGARNPVGPELLTSAPMARLLADLRPSFDVILVDSPPLAAGADACALGTMTGAMLLVLRTGFSDRAQAEAMLDVLERLPIRVLGAVLNDVRLGGEYRYYSYHIAGYEMGDEKPGRDDRRVLQPSD
jgi:tyrosine-protein kinase Etk/Wzc